MSCCLTNHRLMQRNCWVLSRSWWHSTWLTGNNSLDDKHVVWLSPIQFCCDAPTCQPILSQITFNAGDFQLWHWNKLFRCFLNFWLKEESNTQRYAHLTENYWEIYHFKLVCRTIAENIQNCRQRGQIDLILTKNDRKLTFRDSLFVFIQQRRFLSRCKIKYSFFIASSNL